jgi:hypothetical protein
LLLAAVAASGEAALFAKRIAFACILAVMARGGSAAAGPVLLGHETVSNFNQTFDAYGQVMEPTVAVLPPGANNACRRGRLLFMSSNHLLMTSLDGTRVRAIADPGTNLSYVGPAHNPTELHPQGDFSPINDNQIVALPDGSVLASMEGVTTDAVTHEPDWWDDTQTYNAKGVGKKGLRGRLWIMKSTDCGNTWSDFDGVDAATLPVPDPATGKLVTGLCGTPRLSVVLQHLPLPPLRSAEVGGWDGHSLFVDPYTGALYASTSCTYGTLHVADYGKGGLEHNDGVALGYINGHWSVIGVFAGNTAWREAWTSFPSGAAPFVFWGGGPDVRTFTYSALAAPLAVAFGGLDNRLDQVPVLVSSTGNGSTGRDTNISYAINITGYMSVARSVSDKEYILISVPSAAAGAAAPGVMTNAIYRAPIGDHGKVGAPVQMAEIEASTSGASTFHGTFIEGPKGFDVQMYYWLEQAPIGTFELKYVLISDQGTQITTPSVLSKKAGADYSWAYTNPRCGANPCNIGDYMHGTSWWDAKAKEVVFAPTWADDNSTNSNPLALRFAFVRVPILGAEGPGAPVNLTCSQMQAQMAQLQAQVNEGGHFISQARRNQLLSEIALDKQRLKTCKGRTGDKPEVLQ